MIKNLIFDFGNVICRYVPRELIAHYATGEEAEILFRAVYHDWESLDRGTTEYPDYIRAAKAMRPSSLHAAADAFFEGWYRQMPYIPGIEALLQDAKAAGYRLFVLSNAPVCFADMIGYFSVTQYFDGILISGTVLDEKPNLSIYRTALARFCAMPSESVFLDDRPCNVDAACALGIHGILFDGDTEKLRTLTLPRLGVTL